MPADRSGLTIGAGSFLFRDEARPGGRPLVVRYYRPPQFAASSPIVFVLHGTRRDADTYCDAWREPADRFGLLVICPEFTAAAFPRTHYHLGNVVDAGRRPLPPTAWTFQIIERLFDHITVATGSVAARYFLYGHSAGGQFVHRLVLFLPEGRYAVAVAANTGWYTMPTFDGDTFPYGLAGMADDSRRLERALGRRLLILLGERDTDPVDPHLRQTARAKRQGDNRFERGQRFFATAQAEAARRNVVCNWEVATVADAAHSNGRMAHAAARALFEQS